MTETTQLFISLSLQDGDDSELDELMRDLRSEIENSRVDSIENVPAGKAPPGAKGADWSHIGQIAVNLAPTAIPLVFELLKLWLERRSSLPVKINVRVGDRIAHRIEYDPAKMSAKEMESLVKLLKKSARK